MPLRSLLKLSVLMSAQSQENMEKCEFKFLFQGTSKIVQIY